MTTRASTARQGAPGVGDGSAAAPPAPGGAAPLRYVAFSDDPTGGNPAGVVLDARGLSEAQMLATARRVGFSETAFLLPVDDGVDVRYFSPLAEVSFCGHATIAAAVAHAERHGGQGLLFHTSAGDVPVVTTREDDGSWRATLTSVPPRSAALPEQDLALLLDALGWSTDDLDPALPPALAYAGAWHPVLAARTRRRLARLDYAVDDLAALMAERGWTTVDLIWREDETTFHARNPFPPGGVYEDPATGAAAAALGGYLREGGHVAAPLEVTVFQGADMGRPGRIVVGIPGPHEGAVGISVSGAAVAMTGPAAAPGTAG